MTQSLYFSVFFSLPFSSSSDDTQRVLFFIFFPLSHFLGLQLYQNSWAAQRVLFLLLENGRFVFCMPKKIVVSFSHFLFFNCDKTCCKRGTGVDNWLRFGQIGMEWFFTRWKTGSNLAPSRRMGRLYIGIHSTSKRNTR
ncbi:hypothetical protein HDV62DRAFT_52695 [Trichoderma sp. SZMC 28011]